jgi:hypothetical protein
VNKKRNCGGNCAEAVDAGGNLWTGCAQLSVHQGCRPFGTWFPFFGLTPDLHFGFAQGRLGLLHAVPFGAGVGCGRAASFPGDATPHTMFWRRIHWWRRSQNPLPHAACAIIGMLRLRSEARVALLTAPLSMTLFRAGVGWSVLLLSLGLHRRRLYFGAESTGGGEVKISSVTQRYPWMETCEGRDASTPQ